MPDALIAVILVALVLIWWAAWEIPIRRYQRRQRLGHPAEEVAVARAMSHLRGQ
jgi:hypothetical protein